MHLPVVVGWFLDSLGTFLVGFFGLFFFIFSVAFSAFGGIFQHFGAI